MKRRMRSHLAGWEIKNCTPSWREADLEVRIHKAPLLGALLEVEMSNKCTRLCLEAHFEVKLVKHQMIHVRTSFAHWGAVSCGRCNGFCSLSKVSQTCGFFNHFHKLWQACDVRRVSANIHFAWQAGTVQKTSPWNMLGDQGSDFLRSIAFCSIGSSGLLRWFRVIGAALCMTWLHFFVAGAVL